MASASTFDPHLHFISCFPSILMINKFTDRPSDHHIYYYNFHGGCIIPEEVSWDPSVDLSIVGSRLRGPCLDLMVVLEQFLFKNHNDA